MTDAIRQGETEVDLDVLEDLLSFYVRSLNYVLSKDLDRRMAGLEVARGTGKITALLLIDSHPGIRPSKIAAATLRDRPAISRIIAPMVAAGLIEQRTPPTDRSAQELYITPHGHEVAERVRDIARRQSEEFFESVPKRDRDELFRILRDIYHVMRADT